MTRRIFLLLVGIVWSALTHAKTNQPTQEFVITPKVAQQKKMSAGAFKEQLGKVTKQAFDQTTVLVHGLGDLGCRLSGIKSSVDCIFVVGTMQKDLASLQKKYSSIVEKLVENDKPFKKASKVNLKHANDVLAHAHQQLALCAQKVAQMRTELNKKETVSVSLLQKHAQRLQEQHALLSGLLRAMAADECLKTT